MNDGNPARFSVEGDAQEASRVADYYQSIAMQQGVFVKREGNTVWLSGPIIVDSPSPSAPDAQG
jgi:hypothetical protein